VCEVGGGVRIRCQGKVQGGRRHRVIRQEGRRKGIKKVSGEEERGEVR
jgi:hypothetical protein